MMLKRHLPALVLAVALVTAGCAAPTTPKPLGFGTPTAKRGGMARELPRLALPGVGQRALIASPGGASVKGQVAFQVVTHPYFANNAAQRRVLAAMPSGHAMIMLSTLEDNLYTSNSQVIQTLGGADGRFAITGTAPAGEPYLVSAYLAQSQRLSAVVVPGMTEVAIDEASSMIAEMARWQLRPFAEEDGQPSLEDLTASGLADLYADTLEVLAPEDFVATGAVPSIEALKVGAGHLVRNAYVKAFGAATTPSGTTAADRLSDAWTALLGYRPIAVTRVAGNGIRNFNAGDGKLATEAELPGPTDAVYDDQGNMYIAQQDGHTLRFVAGADQGPRFGTTSAMTAGRFYTLAGIANGPTSLSAYNDLYGTVEVDAVADPSLAPAVDDPDESLRPALFSPSRLMVQSNGLGSHDVFVTSRFGNRIFFLPGRDQSRFGRNFLANRLYRLVGDAREIDYTQEDAPDGVVAHSAAISEPAGLTRDSRGNLYFIDGTLGLIRLVRASDGMLFTLPMSLDGDAYTCPGAQDLRVREDGAGSYIYVADTPNHMVFRLPLPADLSTLDDTIPGETPIEIVLGVPGEAGYRDANAELASLPHLYAFYDGMPEAEARLNGPVSLDFDADGHLLVAENGRVRLLESAGLAGDGQVLTIAGGFDTRFLEGDARLGFFPQNGYLNFDPVTRTSLLVDRKENIVRRLWTGRGSR